MSGIESTCQYTKIKIENSFQRGSMTALSISVGKEIALTPEQTGSKERDGWKFIIALSSVSGMLPPMLMQSSQLSEKSKLSSL